MPPVLSAQLLSVSQSSSSMLPVEETFSWLFNNLSIESRESKEVCILK